MGGGNFGCREFGNSGAGFPRVPASRKFGNSGAGFPWEFGCRLPALRER